MSFVVLGINHNTASLELREQVAFMPETLADASQSFLNSSHSSDIVLLSTCNRTEVYTQHCEAPAIIDWLAHYTAVPSGIIRSHSYAFRDALAFRHLIKVCSGLDSMMIGETQIFGQVKNSVRFAQDNHFITSRFLKKFEHGFSAAKRVRTETAVGEYAVSLGMTVVRLIDQIFKDLKHLNILLVGAGDMNTLVARHLVRHGCSHLTIANRTRDNASKLKAALGNQPYINVMDLGDVPASLHQFDVVCTCTASNEYLITKAHAQAALKKRRHKPMLMVDLAVPRDIDPAVDELDDVYLNTIDHLQNVISQNTEQRVQAATEAHQLVEDLSIHLYEQDAIEQIDGFIKNFRLSGEQIKAEELQKALALMDKGTPPEEVLQRFAHQLTSKLLHLPTQFLKDAALQHKK